MKSANESKRLPGESPATLLDREPDVLQAIRELVKY